MLKWTGFSAFLGCKGVYRIQRETKKWIKISCEKFKIVTLKCSGFSNFIVINQKSKTGFLLKNILLVKIKFKHLYFMIYFIFFSINFRSNPIVGSGFVITGISTCHQQFFGLVISMLCQIASWDWPAKQKKEIDWSTIVD